MLISAQSPVRASTPMERAAAAAYDTTRRVGAIDWPWMRLDGTRTSLAALRGRPMVVNLWATWCEPCIAELPSLARLAAQVGDTSVVFVLVAADREARVREFVARRKVTLPVIVELAHAPEALGVTMVPTTWLIDAEGRIVMQHRGARAWDTPEMVARVRALTRAAAR
jgi:thiol-disulfide isomerase/thioredoxin